VHQDLLPRLYLREAVGKMLEKGGTIPKRFSNTYESTQKKLREREREEQRILS
jgi:hypothetical protein